MIKSSKNKLALLILMSIILNLALAGYKATPGADCASISATNCFKIYTNADTAALSDPANPTSFIFKIIAPANQVTGCTKYKADG